MHPTVFLAVRLLTAVMYTGIGVMHFVQPYPFVEIVPPFLPAPLALVYISGFFEIAGGLGLLFAPLRKAAGWGLLALTLAVYPANIYMLTNQIYIEGMPEDPALLWARLPMQFVFLAMIWISMKEHRSE